MQACNSNAKSTSTMAADDRKARLAALAAKSGRNIPSIEDSDGKDESTKPKISFRNYVPKDATLSNSAGEDGQPLKRLKPNNADDTPKSALEQALAKTSEESRQAAGQSAANSGNVGTKWSTVTPVTSKKVNWDLKRDIADKMDKLERRTQRAIVDMLRERLEREAAGGGEEDDSDLD